MTSLLKLMLVIGAVSVLEQVEGIPAQDRRGDIPHECGTASDIVFVLDSSSSIWGPDFKEQLKFVQNIVDKFTIGHKLTRVGVMTFSDKPHKYFGLGEINSKVKVNVAVADIQQSIGGTYTADAIKYMRENMFSDARSSVPQIAIIITDGQSIDSELTAIEAENAKKDGITMFAIGVGRNTDRNELEAIAAKPSREFVFNVKSYSRLERIATSLSKKTCEIVMETPPPPTTSVPIPDTTTVAGGSAGNRDYDTFEAKACLDASDIVFMLDSSSSIWGPDFRKQLTFVQEMIDTLDIGKDATRVGVMTFSTDPYEYFGLEKYHNADDIKDAISSIQQKSGGTNTGKAISHMRENMFNHARPGITKIGVIITDGQSRNPEWTLRQSAKAKHENIHIFAIGVGHSIDRKELEEIASEPKEQFVFAVDNYSKLRKITAMLSRKACQVNRPVVLETKPPVVYIPPTTTTQKPQGFGDEECLPVQSADIAFALTGNEINSLQNRAYSLAFIKSIVQEMNIGPQYVQVGIVPQDCMGMEGFGMNRFYDQNSLFNAIDSNNVIESNPTRTITYMRHRVFNHHGGARQNVKRIGVLIVDNMTNDVERLRQEARNAKTLDKMELFVIGVGRNINTNYLSAIASSSSGRHIYRVSDYSALDMIRENFLNNLCIISN
ncbi:unnamed protein product [Owenia fusiformis]|uniref:VWFA domain-containing protein n=1 Tax=Owenia fusiformis TaxID=6347 RepID=A0A8S4PFB3_OWEFU|nr:unnamed protein product [Owenia fusiformis]